MKPAKIYLYLFLIYSLFNNICFATAKSFGQIADAINQPLYSIASLLHIICLIAGVGLLAGAFFRYLQHRRNPVEATLSSVMTLLITGIACVVLAFVPMPNVEQ